MSTVDVIVPCYRYGHFLRKCVESALIQSGPKVRVLIIDDASPDDTSVVANELVAEDPRVTLIKHAKNVGHIETYNEGLAWASAEYALLLSADDYLLPGALDRATRLMNDNRNVGFTFGNAFALEHDKEPDSLEVTTLRTDDSRSRIFNGIDFIESNGARNSVLTPTVVVRTELQKKVGGYRPELTHSGDMEMWLRLAAQSSVGFIHAHQAVYRRHASNMSHGYSPEQDLEQRRDALICFFQSSAALFPNSDKLKHKLWFALSCEAVRCGSRAFNEGNLELSRKLCQFALTLCPDIKKSLPWSLLSLKQHMGVKMWRRFQPLAASIRNPATLLNNRRS